MTPLRPGERVTRLLDDVRSRFGREAEQRRSTVVTIVALGDPEREGGVYVRGHGLQESTSRFIPWRNVLMWAYPPGGGRRTKDWSQAPANENPEYVRVYLDTVRMLQSLFPDDWQRRLSVLGLRAPAERAALLNEELIPDPDAGVASPAANDGDDIPLDEALANIQPTWKSPKETP